MNRKSDKDNENGVNGKENTAEKEVEYDQLLSSAGEFGLYQILLFFKTSPFYVFGGFVYFTQLFLTEVPKNYWCRIPELGNMSAVERRILAIPADNDSPVGYSQCTSYVANWTEVLLTGGKPDQSWASQECQHGWEYNTTEIPYPTISSELGWVCEKDSYQAIAQSLFFVGSIIGGFIIGWVADRFGRIPAAVFANVIGCVAGIASTFTTNFVEFTICRIFVGMSYDNCMIMAYLLVLEYTAPKYRTLIANLSIAIFFTLGVTALPWIALACGHWKVMALATSIPLALALLAPFVMPESPRWLITQGRVNEVITNVKAIAKTNKKDVPTELIQQFQMSCEKNKQEKSVSLFELLKRPVLRNLFVCICIEYLCIMIIFDALVRTIGSLKYDFFISFTVISFTEFPSLVLLSFILDLTGRKWLCIISLSICGVLSFITPFVGGGLPSVLCAVFARFTCNMAFNSILQWSAELIPTPVRGSGTSIIHICGYIATCVSPFIAYIDNYVSWLSMVIIGAISIFSATMCCYLPETACKEMPQTFEEVEAMMRSRSLWEMPCLQNKGSDRDPSVGHTNGAFETS